MEIIVLISAVISIALIIAVFQINSRLGRVEKRLDELSSYQRFSLLITLNGGEPSQSIVDQMYRSSVITRGDAETIASNMGWTEPVGKTPLPKNSTQSAANKFLFGDRDRR